MIIRLYRRRALVKYLSGNSRERNEYYLDLSNFYDEKPSNEPDNNNLEQIIAYVGGDSVSNTYQRYILELSVLQLPDLINSQFIVGYTKDSKSARVFQNLSTLRNGDYVVEQCEFTQRSDVRDSMRVGQDESCIYERYSQPIKYGPKKTTFFLAPHAYDYPKNRSYNESAIGQRLLHVQDGKCFLYEITAAINDFHISGAATEAIDQLKSDERKADEQRNAEQAANSSQSGLVPAVTETKSNDESQIEVLHDLQQKNVLLAKKVDALQQSLQSLADQNEKIFRLLTAKSTPQNDLVDVDKDEAALQTPTRRPSSGGLFDRT